MEKKGVITKILSVSGTVLVWFPILAPILFGLGFLIRSGQYRLDYLMPAELFFLVLLGSAFLTWAAIRAHKLVRLFVWSFAAAILLLVGSQVVAVVTGLASGRIEASGWQFVIVLGMIFGYILAVIVIGSGGILLTRELFKRELTATVTEK